MSYPKTDGVTDKMVVKSNNLINVTFLYILQNEPSEEELMKMFQGLGLGPGDLGGGGGAEGGDMGGMGGMGDMGSFMPMMQTMMRSILSKDVLYPSLQDISAKVRAFMDVFFFGIYIFIRPNSQC